MAKAFWAGKLVAESNGCVVVEGNQYFPVEAVKREYLRPSSHTSICPWKGSGIGRASRASAALGPAELTRSATTTRRGTTLIRNPRRRKLPDASPSGKAFA